MLDFGLPKQTIDCLIEYFKSKPAIDKVLIFGSREGGGGGGTRPTTLSEFTSFRLDSNIIHSL